MSFQSMPVNTVAIFSEGRFFNVFVITGTVHYPRLDYIKRATFEPPNVMFETFSPPGWNFTVFSLYST